MRLLILHFPVRGIPEPWVTQTSISPTVDFLVNGSKYTLGTRIQVMSVLCRFLPAVVPVRVEYERLNNNLICCRGFFAK